MDRNEDRQRRVEVEDALRTERARHRANMARIREDHRRNVLIEKRRHRSECDYIRSSSPLKDAATQ